MASRKEQKEQARQARLAAEAKARAAAARRQLITRAGLGAGVLVVIAVVIVILATGGGGPTRGPAASSPALKVGTIASLGHLQRAPSPGPIGPEGIPVPSAPQLAGAGSTASGNTVDGISCLGQEQTLFHIHAHLTVFVDGTARQIPEGIGITNPHVQNTVQGPFVGGGSCFYFLHTHAADGIIHIESPAERTYTLGDFFDIWGQPLSPTQAGPAKGSLTALYNGEPYLGNPRDIPLTAHAQIQLDIGRPLVAPESLASFGSL